MSELNQKHPSPGCFGKLPSLGDFVHRRLNSQFLQRWDNWLQAGLAELQQQHGQNWLNVYLTSPIWRFLIAPGVVDSQGYLGIMLPSVDRVGRYYPITVAVPLPSNKLSCAFLPESQSWFASVENLLLECLDQEDLGFDYFDQRLQELPADWSAAKSDSLLKSNHAFGCAEHQQSTLLAHLALESMLTRKLSLWWSDGSELVSPCINICQHLPNARQFCALFNGSWQQHDWNWQPHLSALNSSTGAPKALSGSQARDCAFTDPGKRRDHNEDAYLCQAANGMWVVADGMGGHARGDQASKAVIDRLAKLPSQLSLDQRVDWVQQQLCQVNQQLFEQAQRGATSGSTVIVLLLEGYQAAFVWAGDSRLYLQRDQKLQQLSRDHSLVQNLVDHGEMTAEQALHAGNRNVITKAIGGEAILEPEVCYAEFQPGDRILLCSDGLYGELPTEVMETCLKESSIEQALHQLKTQMAQTAAKDNVTAVLVQL